jgi:chromate transporter
VFGGGHVRVTVAARGGGDTGVGQRHNVSGGYGAAQAVPGPLFTFATYLGAVVGIGPGGLAGAAIGLGGIFLPGMLILVGALPFWASIRQGLRAQAFMRGINAAVVGLLGGALYDPIWTSAIRTHGDFALATAGFVPLIAWRVAPLVVVVLGAIGGIALDKLVV